MEPCTVGTKCDNCSYFLQRLCVLLGLQVYCAVLTTDFVRILGKKRKEKNCFLTPEDYHLLYPNNFLFSGCGTKFAEPGKNGPPGAENQHRDGQVKIEEHNTLAIFDIHLE